MKNIITLLFLLFLFSLPILGFTQQILTESLQHDSLERSYIMYVPANYTGDTAVPLVFNFHGFGSNATEQMFYGDFRPIADTAGFIIIHPEGEDLNGTSHWNVGGFTTGSTVDDIGFTEAMIDRVAGEYNIDLSRVYSTGMSNGGFMSFVLACQLSDKIAAIASVTGSMSPETYAACDPQHPMPVLHIHGTDDSVVPYEGSVWTRSVEDGVAYWVDYNHCNTPATTDIPDTDTEDQSTVERIVYDGGDMETRVEHFKVTGGDHTWPGTAFVFGLATNQDMSASVEIWNFFAQYDLNSLTGTSGIDDEKETGVQVSVYPQPTTDVLTIEVENFEEKDYVLFTLTGQALLSGTINTARTELNVTELSAGIYFLKIGKEMVKILKM